MKSVQITITRFAEKQLKKIPEEIKDALLVWIDRVTYSGIHEVRKIKGYHDEPLKGDRKGQRSIRLNRAYRAIYIEDDLGKVHLVSIIEVSKHKY